ncbi:MAG: hypothetical protein ACTSXT_16630 [Candidatus Helarchaeota archaeon]
MSDQSEVNQISALFENLSEKLDKMSKNIDNISASLINLTDTINESMLQVSDHLEDLINVFEKTFQFRDLANSNKIIENISKKIEDKFDVTDFQNTLNELNEIIQELKELKENSGDE